MGAYILRRILLMIPTLFGIMAISFAVIQFAPGGPVEQVIAKLTGQGGDAADRLSGSSGDLGGNNNFDPAGGEGSSKYRGAQGLDPEFIAKLEKQFGFDKPPLERFFMMLWNYIRFDFGESYFRDVSVLDLILEKMPVSDLARHLDPLLSYMISIPLGIRKACQGRFELRHLDQRYHHHRLRHAGLPVRHPFDRGLCRRFVLRLVPVARPDLGEFRPALTRWQKCSIISGI
jgi:microcin C transport system permease protein